MRILKRVGWVLLLLLGLLILVIGIFIYTQRPDYDGEKTLPELSDDIRVYFDTYGIPHIYGRNEEDAFRALGYVHAQDRLWQMELLRRIGKGGLSEIFGKDLLRTDKFFLALGIDDASTETVTRLNITEKSVQLAQAYLDGINEFIAQGPTPIEFHLTGIEKEPFVLKDIYNTMGYMAFSFAMAHKTDPLLTKIKNELGPNYLKELGVHSDTTSLWLKNHRKAAIDSLKKDATASIFKSLERLSIPLFEGSNGWVIGPEKTKNGNVIFANDPHIGFAQPSVWYEAHVSTPTYEKYGYHLAGVPFPILGHDRNLAYGMTMFENDDVDFYFEETNPEDTTQYKTSDGWDDYEMVSKSIKVKDSTSVSFTFKKTARGPVLNGIADQIDGNRPISMWWTYTKLENKVMDALFGMSHAQDIESFQKSLQYIHAPGLNIMYGDAEGNVAWWATAKLYQIPDSVNTKLVLERSDGFSDSKSYLNFSLNPSAINPPWHYVYSANNQPDSISGMLYPGYYLPENRARRIVELLEPKNDWDRQTVGGMINDNTSSVNVEIKTNLLKLMDTDGLSDAQLEVLDKLKDWKGDYPLSSVEATVFHRWMFHLLETILKDELGEDQFWALQETHLIKRTIAPLLANENSIWWDDINTKDTIETQVEIVNRTFRNAWADLEKTLGVEAAQWTWNRVHRLEHGHPIGQIEALRSFFNVGPFPVNGTREVINNMYFPYTEDGFYEVSAGPSTRRVIDFSDVENSISILPTGQSGNPFSKHYDDQAEMYVKGKFRKMMLNKEEIETTSESMMLFKPR